MVSTDAETTKDARTADVPDGQSRLLAAWRALSAAGWSVNEYSRTAGEGWQVLLQHPQPEPPRRGVPGEPRVTMWTRALGIWVWQKYPSSPVRVAPIADSGWRWLSRLAEVAGVALHHEGVAPRWPVPDGLVAARAPMSDRDFDDLAVDAAKLIRERAGRSVNYEALVTALERLVYEDLADTPLDPHANEDDVE